MQSTCLRIARIRTNAGDYDYDAHESWETLQRERHSGRRWALCAIVIGFLLGAAGGTFGAQQNINLGLAPNDRTGDTLRAAGTKINSNFQELYARPIGISSLTITLPGGFSVAGSPLTSSGTIAITTSLSGMVKVTGGDFAAAVAGTDYLAPAGDGSQLTGLTKAQVGLGNVENTALSTWAGSSTLSTVGTITAGTWQGTAIADARIASAATWNAKLEPTGSGAQLTGLTKAQVGLGNVENTALSTWAGSSTLSTVGTIATGTWQGTAIADAKIASAATWNAKQSALTFSTGLTNTGGTITANAVNLAAAGSGGVTGILPKASGGTGTATPALVAGTNVTITGTWPNQTINASGGGGSSSWLVKTANYTAAAGERIQADTSGGAFTVTLPAAPAVGDEVPIEDATGNWGAAALTIGRNGQSINGAAADFTANVADAKLSAVFVGGATGWSVK